MNTQQFVEAHGIFVRVTRAEQNPWNPKWQNAHHYACTLTFGRKRMQAYFSMGLGLTRYPKAAEVLDCLAGDAADWENTHSFEEWAREYGYEADSQNVQTSFKAVRKVSSRLKTFLGAARYQDLLWNTERIGGHS